MRRRLESLLFDRELRREEKKSSAPTKVPYSGPFSKQGASDTVKTAAADPKKKKDEKDPNELVGEFQRKAAGKKEK